MTRALPLLLLALAAPAHAQRLGYSCTFTATCGPSGCEPLDATYAFRFDTDAGTGTMVAAGQTYPGAYSFSTGLHHYILVNDAGAELVTIAADGAALYSGHIGAGGPMSWYRLEGTCTGAAK